MKDSLKDTLAYDLLQIQCSYCEGEREGCCGCTVELEINEVLSGYQLRRSKKQPKV